MNKLILGLLTGLFTLPLLGMGLSAQAQAFLQTIPEGSSVGIYCGTFDPIHFGHKANIDYCIASGKTHFIIVHVGSSPEKPDATDRATRALMAKAALADNPRIFVSTENLPKLHEILGQKNCTRVSIWGSDHLPNLTRSVQETLKSDPFPSEELVILPRATDSTVIETIRPQTSLKGKPFHIPELHALPHREVSSTEIRNRIKTTGSCDELSNFVAEAALGIIRSRKLYHSQ